MFICNWWIIWVTKLLSEFKFVLRNDYEVSFLRVFLMIFCWESYSQFITKQIWSKQIQFTPKESMMFLIFHYLNRIFYYRNGLSIWKHFFIYINNATSTMFSFFHFAILTMYIKTLSYKEDLIKTNTIHPKGINVIFHYLNCIFLL